MGLMDRVQIYREIEALRGRPLVAMVTSARLHASGSIASDMVGELSRQLNELPQTASELDLLIVSNGGDPTVAWRVVSMIRERVSSFDVLVPQSAFSAATMIALGANQIVMHPNGNLGPIDSQIVMQKSAFGGKRFGSEDLNAVLELARKVICENESQNRSEMLEVFKIICEEIDPLAIGFTSRSIKLTNKMASKMLEFHMNNENDREAIARIVDALHQDFFDHGYPISLTEANEIGLNAVAPAEPLKSLLWRIWRQYEDDLELRRPFSWMRILKNNPACHRLFEKTNQILLPQGLTPEQVDGFVSQILQSAAIIDIPATSYDVTLGLMESTRTASRCYDRGCILAQRQPDLEVNVTPIQDDSGWEEVPITGTDRIP